MKNILIIQPFRKPKFKEMVVTNYPFWEVINVAPLVTAAILKESYNVQFLSLKHSEYRGEMYFIQGKDFSK